MSLMIPELHRDLLEGVNHAVLSTLMPDGQPQSSLVWIDYDGEYLLINTTLERQKGRNLRANPRATVLVIDPRNGSRWIEVRGTVAAITTEGAEAHADRLALRYAGKAHFYGDLLPVDQREKETRVIVKIAPEKISLDAIFG